MYYCTVLISLLWLLHGGQSRPSYNDEQGGYAPVGYHGALATTVVLKSGHLADTPEVSAAKNLHYAALQKANAEAAAHGYSGNDGSYDSGAGYDGISSGYGSYDSSDYGSSNGNDAKHAPVGYQGPLAKVVLLKSGHLADTPEVSAAKNLQYAALQKANAEAAAHGYSGDDGSYDSGAGYGGVSSGYGGGYGSYGFSDYGSSNGNDAKHAPVGYQGPLAKVVLLKSGHIADTPEVSAAKHIHYSALEKANAAAGAHGYGGDNGSYGSDGGYGSSYSSGVGYGTSYSSVGSGSGYTGSYKYSGPLAYPKVLPSGQLADTHEVAAARHAHLNALSVTALDNAQKWTNNYSY